MNTGFGNGINMGFGNTMGINAGVNGGPAPATDGASTGGGGSSGWNVTLPTST